MVEIRYAIDKDAFGILEIYSPYVSYSSGTTYTLFPSPVKGFNVQIASVVE